MISTGIILYSEPAPAPMRALYIMIKSIKYTIYIIEATLKDSMIKNL